MNNVLKSRLVKIGNSRGVRIPKVWLDQLELHDEVEMAVEAGHIVIRPAHHPRQGWAEAAREMAALGDDHLLDEPTPTEWESSEWEW
jgi:antitoxin MazE